MTDSRSDLSAVVLTRKTPLMLLQNTLEAQPQRDAVISRLFRQSLCLGLLFATLLRRRLYLRWATRTNGPRMKELLATPESDKDSLVSCEFNLSHRSRHVKIVKFM